MMMAASPAGSYWQGTEAFSSGEVQVGVDYIKQQGVKLDRRSYSAIPLQILEPGAPPQYRGSGSTPYGAIVVPEGNTLGLDPGRYRLLPGTRRCAFRRGLRTVYLGRHVQL